MHRALMGIRPWALISCWLVPALLAVSCTSARHERLLIGVWIVEGVVAAGSVEGAEAVTTLLLLNEDRSWKRVLLYGDPARPRLIRTDEAGKPWEVADDALILRLGSLSESYEILSVQKDRVQMNDQEGGDVILRAGAGAATATLTWYLEGGSSSESQGGVDGSEEEKGD